MKTENVAQKLRCRYVHDALNRLVMESVEIEGAEDREFSIIHVHQGLLPQPYAQLQYNEGIVINRTEILSSSEKLSRQTGTTRYRHSTFSAANAGNANNRVQLPFSAAAGNATLDTAVWYGYRDGSIQTASVLSRGGQLRSYMLTADANMDIRTVSDLRSAETVSLDYEVYGKRLSGDDRIAGPVFPGFAGVIQNSLTGLSSFGYRFYSPRLRRFLNADPLRSGYDWFAYCDNDPVNYRDVLGLLRQGFLGFDVNNERLRGFFYDDENDNLESITVVDLFTSNNQRDRSNPTLNDTPGGEVLRTINADGSAGEPYIPRGFPPGSFAITGVYDRDRPIVGQQFIATSATQKVEVYEQDEEGEWRPKVDEHGNLVKVYDHGYGIHGGGYTVNEKKGIDPMTNNNPNDNTLGCGRQSTKDNAWLAELCREVIADGGQVEGCAYYW